MVGPAGIIASAPRGGGVGGGYTNGAYTATAAYGGGGHTAAPVSTYSTYNAAPPASTYGASAYGTGHGSAAVAAARGRAAQTPHMNARYGRAASSHSVGARRTKTPLGARVGYHPAAAAGGGGAYNVGSYGAETEEAAQTTNYGLHRAATPGRVQHRPAVANHAGGGMWGASNYALPQRVSSRVTLVLDLDETLVHSSFEPCEADLHIPLVMDGERYVAYVKKRPYMEQFLARAVELFDVIVWTASLPVYAEPLINELCRLARCGSVKQMYRCSCSQLADGGYVKDLTAIGKRLEDVCILDNSPSVAQLQPKNLLPIVSWYDDPRDTCLGELIPHLEKLATCRSVHDVIPSMPGCGGGGGGGGAPRYY